MSLSINTNISAMNIVDTLGQSDTSLNTAIQRLSTGLQINSPEDDPSGYITSQGLKSLISGMTTASQNTQTAINVAKTASGAMSQISTLLQSMYSLAVSAANSAVTDSNTAQSDQTQLQSMIQGIDQIANSTQFGGLSLLNGSAGTAANITNASDVSSMYLGTTFGGAQLASGPVTVQTVTQATEAQASLNKTFASPNTTLSGTGNIVLNGSVIDVTAGESVSGVVAAINQAAGQTGVTASLVQGGGGTYTVQLNQANYGSQFGINFVDSSNLLNSTPTVTASGTDGVFDVTANTAIGAQTVTFTGGQTSGASGLQITDGTGNSLTITPAGEAALTTASQVGTVVEGSMQFQIGAGAGQTAIYSMPSLTATNLGTNVVQGTNLSNLNISSQSGATTAISVIQAAIDQVSEQNSQIGSFQNNVLQAASNSLGIATQNVTATQSDIADVNVAAETTTFTQAQVLEQSGLAILAQANQNPQTLLQLIKGG